MRRVSALAALLAISATVVAGGPYMRGDGPAMPPYHHRWMERVRGWEEVMPELEDFHRFLASLDLTESQNDRLDAITAEVEESLQELREDYDLTGTRRAVFEAFADDMYMASSVEMAIWDRQWFQQDALHLVTDAMGEIHEILSEEQLETAREIIGRLPEMGPRRGRFHTDGRPGAKREGRVRP